MGKQWIELMCCVLWCRVNGQGGLWLRGKKKEKGGGMSCAIVDLLLRVWYAVVHSQRIGRPVTRGKETLKRWVVPLVICCCAESADWAIHDLQGKKKGKKRVAPLSMSYCADRVTCEPTATSCNTLHYAATHLNTLEHTLQQSATHCNTLQHTATLCNTLTTHESVWKISTAANHLFRFWCWGLRV